jgi:hypothetical protein
MNLTDNEAVMLKNIIWSDYHDGAHPVGNHVWFDNPFDSATTCGGVCASLSRKGLAEFSGYVEPDPRDRGREDRTMSITLAGWNALMEADPVLKEQMDKRYAR